MNTLASALAGGRPWSTNIQFSLPCPADQMLMWENSPQVNSPKKVDVNTGSDRDNGKRLTRFAVAISHIGLLEVTMSLPGGKAVAEIRLYDFRALQLTIPDQQLHEPSKFKGN